MNIKRRLMILTFILVLTSSACKPKPATTVTPPAPQFSIGDQIIADAKAYGPVVAASLDEGIKQEAHLAAAGVIDPAFEPKLKQGLLDAQKVLAEFNAKIATWEHFDASKRDDINKLINDSLDFVQRLYDQGVLHIKNPQSQQIASSILSGAKVTLILWQSKLPPKQ